MEALSSALSKKLSNPKLIKSQCLVSGQTKGWIRGDCSSALLNRWADLMDDHKEDLAILMTAEQGKPLKESRSEIGYANSFIRLGLSSCCDGSN